jgi:carbamoyltransferase
VSVALGLQVVHDAACAVVVDGELVAAVAQERFSRRKHDGDEMLSHRMPIRQCLDAAGVGMDDVDIIVSSWQSASPGGFGLHRPLLDPEFDAFDPYDKRHRVISHHLAHAWSAFGTSSLDQCAVLVCDLAGSTTTDGADFVLPFDEWVPGLISARLPVLVRTECLSIYRAGPAGLRLLDREYCVPHNAPRTFVFSVASLYENVSRRIFGGDDCHGQTMALAGLDSPVRADRLTGDDLVAIEGSRVRFPNDWQHRVDWQAGDAELIELAAACQDATERALLAYARRAAELTELPDLAVAGGSFLNIPANTRICSSGLFSTYHVPSAPHDSGIAIGCAYAGHFTLGNGGRRAPSSDRLGIRYDAACRAAALAAVTELVIQEPASADRIAADLARGDIVARWSGRAEFGPRALGGRSLLASPTFAASKDRLNRIKGRQAWRPVAPVVPLDRLQDFFNGPASPYMSYTHTLRAGLSSELPALAHPDGTTRAQSLAPGEDCALADLLYEFEKLTSYPILCNTSLNGPNEPMVETPAQAIGFFLAHEEVASLLLQDVLVRRRD